MTLTDPAASARCMFLADGEIQAGADDPRAIAWLARDALPVADTDVFWVHLGVHDGQQHYAAVQIGAPRKAEAAPFRPPRLPGFLGLHQLRRASSRERQFAARALHMGAWLHRSRFCGSCGSSMRFNTELNKGICTSPDCGYQHYPRIEPAIITLLTDGDNCLLARQASFPKGYYAPIAGFIEPGETPEQAVMREALEETGQAVRTAAYVEAQPWPYPGSLMLGFIATVDSARPLQLSDELEDAAWIARPALAAALADPRNSALFLPPRGVIGHSLLQHWLAAETKAPSFAGMLP